jgi:hypothetical protein
MHRIFPLFVVAVAISSARLPAQTLSVSVRDSAGVPLAQVGLALLDSAGRVVANARTSAAGVAHMPRADTGVFRVFARRFGFRPRQTDLIRIGPGDTVAIRLTLDRLATVLDPVTIFAQRDSVRDSRVFGINLRATGGYIITPGEIEFSIMGARDIADVLARRALPGILIDHVRRCPRSNRAPGCLPFVIDGQLFPDGSAIQDVIVPEMIEFIVVLRGSEVGVRYGSIGHNGIILIATKQGTLLKRR